MGDRSYIVIESKDFDSDIVIYSHWGGNNNVTVAVNVLTFTQRIGDADYLAAEIIRMAFEENNYDGSLGMGVSTLAKGTFTENWADNPTVYINADTGRWRVGDTEYDRWAKPWDGEEN
jgi:hypothetical protein